MTTGADWVDSARRLLDALRPPAAAPSADAPGVDGAAHGADCRWCPVCQTTAVLRGERPEVSAALADVLATTASVLRDLAGEPERAGAAPTAPTAPTAPDPQEAPDTVDHPDEDTGPGTVQRIDIA